MLAILASLAICLLPGAVCAEAAVEQLPTGRPRLLFQASLAVGLGFGISSCFSSIYILLFRRLGVLPEAAAAVLGIVGLILWRRYADSKRRGSPVSPEPESRYSSRSVALVGMALGAALVSAVATITIVALKTPHGLWDAWTIWNLRARFLFRGGAHWTDVAGIWWAKPDYPLMTPAAVAGVWAVLGSDTWVVPTAMHLMFVLATVGLIAAALALLRGRMLSYVGALALLSTPAFLIQGASQYADVPLAFFILATVVLLTFHSAYGGPHSPALLALAGLAAGLAAWTKNEGLLFVCIVTLCHGGATVLEKGWRLYWKELRIFVAGIAPVLLIVLIFKLGAPANDLAAGQGLHATVGRLTDASRYWIVFVAFAKGIFLFGEVTRCGMIPIIAAYALFVGVRVKTWPVLFLCSTILLTLAGYFFVYVTTPHDLRWHLNTSLDRIITQLFPAIVFALILTTRSSEQGAKSSAMITTSQNS
jgi:hypothetical protein